MHNILIQATDTRRVIQHISIEVHVLFKPNLIESAEKDCMNKLTTITNELEQVVKKYFDDIEYSECILK